MTLKEAANILGINEIPEGMVTCYEALEKSRDKLCSFALIDSLQEKYELFGKYFDAVKAAFEDLCKNKARRIWLDTASLFFLENDIETVCRLPLPETDGTISGDLFALFVLLPSTDAAYNNYRSRGFSHDEAVKNLNNYKLNIWVMEELILGRPAITGVYYRWLCLYAKCRIFDHGGLNFQLKSAPKSALYLKNKRNGEIQILMSLKGVHRSGLPLGSAGCEDNVGSFTASFEESETEFIGNPVINYRTQKEKMHFPKTEWECVLRPGDDTIGIHIPRKTDLSPKMVSTAYREAKKIFQRAYPEWNPKAFHCSSWMMDPALNELLGENSKISQFSAPFIRYPNRNNGKDIFGYVFPKDAADLASLPEDTSLQRKMKERYLRGEYIYSYTGVILWDAE